MRKLNVTDYNVSIRNDQGEVKFRDEKCGCGLDFTDAEPVNPKIMSLTDGVAECPQCGKANSVIVPERIEFSYDTKGTMIDILLARTLGLTGTELLERDDIARKILHCADGYVLLEEEEWKKLHLAVNTITGLGRQDVEMVRRIANAKEVDVEVPKEG